MNDSSIAFRCNYNSCPCATFTDSEMNNDNVKCISGNCAVHGINGMKSISLDFSHYPTYSNQYQILYHSFHRMSDFFSDLQWDFTRCFDRQLQNILIQNGQSEQAIIYLGLFGYFHGLVLSFSELILAMVVAFCSASFIAVFSFNKKSRCHLNLLRCLYPRRFWRPVVPPFSFLLWVIGIAGAPIWRRPGHSACRSGVQEGGGRPPEIPVALSPRVLSCPRYLAP
jgi:hypothetical protein